MTETIPQSAARIIGCSPEGVTVCASAARISTMQGTALELLERSREKTNNVALVQKVLASGHKSVMEHCCFNLAFNNVSIFAEQFIIEFRLASYTVKSRRYVDFGQMGYHIDPTAPEALQTLTRETAEALFARYSRLLELGVPKEDARFVLPYCAHSNFFCTCNARELLHMICSMQWGRGRVYPEIAALGAQLAGQFEAYFPGILAGEAAAYAAEPIPAAGCAPAAPQPARCIVSLPAHSAAPDALLQAAHEISGTDPAALRRTTRPRELELLHFTYRIDGISLAAVTHLVRHRMLSVLIPPVQRAALAARYVLPDSVAALPEALALYRGAFGLAADAAAKALALGAPQQALVYFAMSGHTLDVIADLNGRELMHFCRLRTCTRAQWEIRAIALDMLRQARAAAPGAVQGFGPACYSLGHCTEGRMCCGRADEVAAQIDAL